MDPPILRRDDILAQFDRLLSTGEILWVPSTSVTSMVVDGFPFEFRVTPAQKNKPSFPTDAKSSSTPNGIKPHSNANANGIGNPRISDIDDGDPAWHLAHVCGTHRLIYNKYCIWRPQYILLTRDPSLRQTSPLDAGDLRAAWTALAALSGAHYAIFNCARQAGGSRMHKHMQIFEQGRDALLPDVLLSPAGTAVTVPYRYCLTPLELPEPSDAADVARRLERVYATHVQRCREMLAAAEPEAELRGDVDVVVPHNTVLTHRWIFTVPRRAAGLGAATANAAGFMGLVWVTTEEVAALWRELGPAKVLAELGVPSG